MIVRVCKAVARSLPQPTVQRAFDFLNRLAAFQRRLLHGFAVSRLLRRWPDPGPGLVPLRRHGRFILANAASRFSAVEAAESNLRLVTAAAHAADIDFRLGEPGPDGTRTVSVDAADIPPMLEALARTAAARPVYVRFGAAHPPVLACDAPSLTGGESLTVFEYAAAGDLLLADERLGCTVVQRPAKARPAPVTVLNEPVDVVYTWVDGSDPEWARAKSEAWDRTHPGELHKFAANDERYRSHDELRYSLRSIDYFAPWVNRIFLVTAGQVPAWLNHEDPRIVMVDHRQIFADPSALPTFNSHAIEAQLHRIPGLSEHFLYLNDDVFLGRPVRPELFFHGNGVTKFFFSDQRIVPGAPDAGDLPVDSAAKRNRALMEERFGRTVEFKFKHAPHAQRVSTLTKLAEDFAVDHAATTAARFRSPGDISIPSSLAHHYGYAIGAAVPADIAYRYCDIGAPLAHLKLLRLLHQRDADVFCLNEVGGTGVDPQKQDVMVQRFLQSYYPVPSSFERDS